MEKFQQLLLELREINISKRGMGESFERFIKQFFLIEKLYSNLIDEAWLWSEFPYNGNKPDTGIDVVVKTRDTNEFWAIQCKFYDEKYSVTKADIDTFLSASGKSFSVEGKEVFFTERYVISTTDKWSKNAEDAIVNQYIPVYRLRLQDLKESSIDWDSFSLSNIEKMKNSEKKILRPHQIEAIESVMNSFETYERGKLVMACGTGKTFTSLKIAERVTSGKGNILFLVPSISLLNQTLIEWSSQCQYDFKVIAICSDAKASKTAEGECAIIPATTNVEKLLFQYNQYKYSDSLNFVFSTYQSIDIVNQLQKQSNFDFDLIICDEAHRTTGITLSDDDESGFVKVHNNDYIKGKKRLYMTATPRIYAEDSKNKAAYNNAVLCSMDDETIFGPEFYVLGFSKAVEMGLLSDYKVLVLAVDENYVSRTLQRFLTDGSNELIINDSVKIIGCLNGLSKKIVLNSENDYFKLDPQPMKSAVAFSSKIEDSKKFVELFRLIVDNYRLYEYDETMANVELEHVDGTFNALKKKEKIDWLKENTEENVCRVLSNARCLSEGIDVPSLDAVIFLNPKNSIIDIVQSVGRVMRKSVSKKYGYIILPVGIPAGVEPEEALNDNKKYKIIWDVLQALRAHDDRFDNTINKIELNKRKPDNIQIIGVSGSDSESQNLKDSNYTQLSMHLDELENWKNCIYAKIVKKCGSREYWEVWAKEIAEIAQRHIAKIHLLLDNKEVAEKFDEFLIGIRANLNPTITEDEAIEMLAEHIITKPVFDALFDNYEFLKNNPISNIMQNMLDILNDNALDKEQQILNKFYASVQKKAKGIDNADGKQKIILELYEQFFKTALPKQVAKLGIVYTPIEVVDFIIKSVEYILGKEFGLSINNNNVHVLDPFTGTGTFIVRLLRSGIITKEQLLYKYTSELHANEIVLLAYYIAAINIEETFHGLYGKEEYIPFNGIVLTDTFELSENNSGDMDTNKIFYKNTDRALKQLEAPIKIIIGNPPYSVGQKSGNDNNQNIKYEKLESSISYSYVKYSNAKLNRNAYDTYIKAFRWATDRLDDNGIIGFVTNGAYIDSAAFDGFRKCLLDDFNSIYCFNLRGNQRTSGELSRKEGGKIFGSGSRTPIAITILIKKKGVKKDNYIHYYDIGDYLSRQRKLDVIKDFGDISKIDWEVITPDKKNDWIKLRNPKFESFIEIGNKRKQEKLTIFSTYSQGLITSRDSWIYNYDNDYLVRNINNFMNFYNMEVERTQNEYNNMNTKKSIKNDNEYKNRYLISRRSNDNSKINWSRSLDKRFLNAKHLNFNNDVRLMSFRPFCKEFGIYDTNFIEMPSKWNGLYPCSDSENVIINISSPPLKKQFSSLVTNTIQDYHFLEQTQCFPLYYYEEEHNKNEDQISLFNSEENKVKYKRRSAITDIALKKFRSIYGNKVTKEDIFYYVYAVLNCKKYIELYKDNLAKELPRMPMLNHFAKIEKIGRDLAEIHLNYENERPFKDVKIDIKKENYYVVKMKFGKEGKKVRKDIIIYNDYITISNIPIIAYDFLLNGKSAIEWIMEKYQVILDKKSTIKNDPNNYKDEKYIFNLLLSIITLSIKTFDITNSMPEYEEI